MKQIKQQTVTVCPHTTRSNTTQDTEIYTPHIYAARRTNKMKNSKRNSFIHTINIACLELYIHFHQHSGHNNTSAQIPLLAEPSEKL